MGYVKFDPFHGFETVAKKMNDIAGDFEKGFNLEFGSYAPRVDIAEDEKQIFIHAELPGLKKDDVKVTVNDENVLIIKGEKKREEKADDKEKSYIRVERTFGSFSRSFMLPNNVKTDSINAKFEKGVLELVLDKVEPSKPKEVEININ